jgi:hypothetical protein
MDSVWARAWARHRPSNGGQQHTQQAAKKQPLSVAIRTVSLNTMSFFEPLPPEPSPQQHPWGPPVWDRPSDGTLPFPVPVGAVLHQTTTWWCRLTRSMSIRTGSPSTFTSSSIHIGHKIRECRCTSADRIGGPNRWPRVGVRFADGRTGGRGQRRRGGMDIEKDEKGLPTGVYVGFGGGGSGGWRFRPWVYPLPPEGPVEIFVGVPAGPDEASITVDGSVIRSAAGQSKVIWS